MRLAVLVVLSVTPLLAAQAPPVSRPPGSPSPSSVVTTGTGSLSGVVHDGSGGPTRRVIVAVAGGPRLTFSTVTDDQGRFSLMNLPPGRYTVTASKRGYPSTSYGAKRPNRPGPGVTLADGQAVTGLQLVLQRGGVLSGTVLDERGQPMPGVPVMPWEIRTALSGERTIDMPSTGGESVVSDDRGRYRLFGLPPGEYTVGTAWFYSGVSGAIRVPTDAEIRAAFLAASQPKGPAAPSSAVATPRTPLSTRNYSPVFLPGVTDPMVAATVQLAPGEERDGLNLLMQFRPLSKIEGQVVGPEGPVAGAELGLFRRNRVEALTSSTHWTTNDKEGRFTTGNLGPGDYTVRARTTSEGGRTSLFAIEDVSITSADPVTVTLRLEPALTIAGRVVIDAADGAPAIDLAQVRVSMSSLDAGSAATIGTSTTNADGTFSIIEVTPGRFRFAVTAPGGTPQRGPIWMLQSVSADGQDLTDLPVDIARGDPRTFTVTLTNRISELSGTLIDGTGRPATDFFVLVAPADRRYWVPGRRVTSARPDVGGRFIFNALPPGDYRIAVTTDLVPRDLADVTALDQLMSQSAAVTLGSGERRVFDIKLGGN